MKTLLRSAVALAFLASMTCAPVFAQTDPFQSYSDNVSAPARSATAVTPSDATPLPKATKALYVGTAGNITLRAVGDTADSVWKNIPAGAILPVRVIFVRSTGTTASDILALNG